MYDASAAARVHANPQMPSGAVRYPPPANIPSQNGATVKTFIDASQLPYLNPLNMNPEKLYTSQIPINNMDLNNATGTAFNPQMFSMLKLLPPNYNLSRIPPEVITQLLHGEIPDFAKLPQDIIDYLRENSDLMFNSFKITVSLQLPKVLSNLRIFDSTFVSNPSMGSKFEIR